jgi:ABC-2 type transport system permease protein
VADGATSSGARSVAQLVRLLGLYARMDWLWVARARSSALTFYVAEWVMGVSVVAATWLLAARFDGIGPWTHGQVVFLLGYSLLVRGTVEMGFGWNVAHVSRRIGRGQLDHMLLQPAPLWVLVLSEGFSPLSGSGLLLSGVALIALSGVDLAAIPPLLFAVNWVASVVVVLAFSYAWGSLAFWAPRAAEEINSSTMALVDQLRGFPLDGLGAGLIGLLLSLVPVGFVAWLPARSLLGLGGAPWQVWAAPVGATVIAGVALLVFSRGVRHYRATGSVRYLALGHRR